LDFNKQHLTPWHVPVMLDEVINILRPKNGSIIIDNTVGGAGHAEEIIKAIAPEGILIGIDRDKQALCAARNRLSKYKTSFKLIHGNFKDVLYIAKELDLSTISGALYDLGISWAHVDYPERGFSYIKEGPLDMRMDSSQKLTAYEVINSYSEEKLNEIFKKYGEERYSYQIARVIVDHRKKKKIETTLELTKIINNAVSGKARRKGHPSKRIFQAIRIEVNDELNSLKQGLEDIFKLLEVGGRIVVLSYHSLEDRLVKNTFLKLIDGCICPEWFPICTCDRKDKAKVISKGALMPTSKEVMKNPRASSAKLRAIEKVQPL